MVLPTGTPPQVTVILEGAVIVGNVAGLTVIMRVTGISVRPHASVAVHVSVTAPPQALGVAVKVDVLEVPLSSQPPLKLLL